ncbi:MAG TPA: hypothetical protein PK079_15620 [Leptospiraceae bacterium]|nr:hypothetical protein [Leptospiraceae bacterium]HMX34059.1 hypothetical protein [Leptospiraceae bacterium]HMY32967.1 hypothetical protein [Leptospiraceae bacterium]HMZ64581.1 hypothetical protein [Leptospiraceae bacterium]HNA08182.1 hypothetical protein [Leptospiraceae bacterium]
MKNSRFQPAFKTRDIQLLSILKFHLEEEEIPYFVTGENFLFLENLAVPSHESYAVLYLLPEDFEKFEKLLEDGFV